MTADTPSTLVPKLRFPEFQDAPGWQRRLMSRYLSESRIKGSGGHEAKKLTVKLWGKGVFEKNDTVQGSENTQYYRRRAGQFIYSKLDFLNQAFGIIPEHLDGFESTVDLPCFDISSEMNAKFLLEYVQREQFYKTRGEIADGGRKAKRIQVETFLECPIYAPSEREQQKVADCLGSLDNLIAAEGQKLEALRQHKQGLMQQLFPQEGETVPRLRFPEFHNEEGWKPHKFGDFVIKSFYGTSASTSETGRYPVLRMGNMSDGGLNFSNLVYIDLEPEEFESFRLQKGDILLNRTNSRDLVGKISIFDRDTECITASYIVSFRLDEKRIDPWFCNLMLNTQMLQSQIKLLATPSISQSNINPTTFRSGLDIVIPKLAEQQRIAVCLSSLDNVLAAQLRNVESLKAHKQGLLQLLFPTLEAE
ncbi:hypothetical protein TSH100_27100 [Azospirillum sp. TSH100]|uniref:restriction endonuclease subunit S n=1 Tax=Azospirillum sp. TSH100 TaxID=652764 RepID=UPI000D607F50|nr:restriction endonuclease subunit S [Azospirillum sp. TSH100]PWC81513.1 hypothetical protein TSH100_27100 [Azospirillum sp. TSH100]QCG91357.1 restriction endonuclease subunit S [Azospirillum sp. TSH100]